MRRAGVPLASVLLGLLPWCASSAADPPAEPIPVESLPVGPPPASPYLKGLTIHDGAHRVHVPLHTGRSHDVTLLGTTPSGYAVADLGPRWATVYVLREGHLRVVRRVENRDHWTQFLLGTDGRHVLEVNRLDEPVVKVSVYDLRHRHVQKTGVRDFRSVTFDGHVAYLVGEASWVWRPGHAKAKIWPSAAAGVDPHSRVLWVRVTTPTGEGSGPTSLDAPTTPTWSARFIPSAVSPGGQYVSGFSWDAHDLQIRRMSDGSVVRELSAPFYYFAHYYDPLGHGTWDTDDTVLAVVGDRRHETVVRCPVSGGCQVAVPQTSGLSFPDDQLVWP